MSNAEDSSASGAAPSSHATPSGQITSHREESLALQARIEELERELAEARAAGGARRRPTTPDDKFEPLTCIRSFGEPDCDLTPDEVLCGMHLIPFTTNATWEINVRYKKDLVPRTGHGLSWVGKQMNGLIAKGQIVRDATETTRYWWTVKYREIMRASQEREKALERQRARMGTQNPHSKERQHGEGAESSQPPISTVRPAFAACDAHGLPVGLTDREHELALIVRAAHAEARERKHGPLGASRFAPTLEQWKLYASSAQVWSDDARALCDDAGAADKLGAGLAMGVFMGFTGYDDKKALLEAKHPLSWIDVYLDRITPTVRESVHYQLRQRRVAAEVQRGSGERDNVKRLPKELATAHARAALEAAAGAARGEASQYAAPRRAVGGAR